MKKYILTTNGNPVKNKDGSSLEFDTFEKAEEKRFKFYMNTQFPLSIEIKEKKMPNKKKYWLPDL